MPRPSNKPITRDALLDALADQSRSRPIDRLRLSPLLWLTVALVWVAGLGSLLDPLRPHAHDQLLEVPRFGLEILLGLASVAATALLAFRLARPAATSRTNLYLAATAVLGWLATLVLTYMHPAIEPSMLGKRPSCEWEAFALSIPPAIAGVIMLRSGFVTRPWLAGLLIAFAAGVLPAVFMQLACMLDPSHMVTHHLLPAAIVTVVMGVVGAWAVRPNRSRPSTPLKDTKSS